MELHDGDKLWLAFVGTETDGSPRASVAEATVLSAADRAVRVHGWVRSIYTFERVCVTEGEAWDACAEMLNVIAGGVRKKIDECQQKAAQSRVGSAVPA